MTQSGASCAPWVAPRMAPCVAPRPGAIPNVCRFGAFKTLHFHVGITPHYWVRWQSPSVGNSEMGSRTPPPRAKHNGPLWRSAWPRMAPRLALRGPARGPAHVDAPG